LGFEFAIFLKDFGKSDLKGLKSCIAFESDFSANTFQHDKLDRDGEVNGKSVINAIGIGLVVSVEL
jgi:hypothetical protein